MKLIFHSSPKLNIQLRAHVQTIENLPPEYKDVSAVDLTPEQVLGGTYVDLSGEHEGIMVDNGAVHGYVNPMVDEPYIIPEGYHSGTGTVLVDSQALVDALSEVSGSDAEGVPAQISDIGGYIDGSFDALTGKGVSVPSGSKLLNLPGLISEIDIPEAIEFGSGPLTVQWIDYTDEIIRIVHCNIGDDISGLIPAAPDHSGDIIQRSFFGWNHNISKLESVPHDMIIDAIYSTADGRMHLRTVVTPATGKTFAFYFSRSSGASITLTLDFDDGDTDTLTMGGTIGNISHEFDDYGIYDVTVYRSAGTNGWGPGYYNSSTYYAVVGGTNQAQVSALIEAAVCGCDMVGAGAFKNCFSLEKLSICNTASSIGNQAFYGCNVLRHIGVPSNITTIGLNAFQNLHSCDIIGMPDTITTMGASTGGAFYNCYSVKKLVIPESLTTTTSNSGQYAGCTALRTVIYASNTAIDANDFNNCQSVLEYVFYVDSVVTLSNTNALNLINPLCKIYVPDELYDDWIVDINWSTIANQIYPLSER